MGQYIGIDLHKAKSFVTRVNGRGRILEQVELPHATGELQQYLERLPAEARIAVEATWPGVAVQRCTVHTLRNLERHAPKHAVEEIRTDSHAIVYAETLSAARQASRAFVSQWHARAPKVVEGLEEAGEERLTFYRFPASQWKSLRTTNAIKRLKGEFRRSVKTQGSLPNAQAAELRLFGLIAMGQIRMRRIDGWRDLAEQTAADAQRAA